MRRQSSGRSIWRVTTRPVAASIGAQCSAGTFPRLRHMLGALAETLIWRANLTGPPTISIAALSAASCGFSAITFVMIGPNTNVMQLRSQITNVNTIADRIRQTREGLGLSQEQLAKLAAVSQGTIGNLESGLRKKPRELLAIAAALKVSPHWLATGKPSAEEVQPQYQPEGASAMNQPSVTVIPLLEWEGLMTAELPHKFELAAPDDSMAPRVRSGQLVTFETGINPLPGDGVLVVDGEGNRYLRQYRQKRPGHFEAHALNEAYQPMDSEQDRLTVLAVVVAVQARWS